MKRLILSLAILLGLIMTSVVEASGRSGATVTLANIPSITPYGFTFQNNRPIYPLRIDGNSMYPTLLDGGIVFCEQYTFKEIQADFQDGKRDVIDYQTIFNRTIHRVADIGNDDLGPYIVTKGDNNPDVDFWLVRPEDVIGRLKVAFQ